MTRQRARGVGKSENRVPERARGRTFPEGLAVTDLAVCLAVSGSPHLLAEGAGEAFWGQPSCSGASSSAPGSASPPAF